VLKQYGVIEMVRTGRVAMSRGPKSGVIRGVRTGTKRDDTVTDEENVSYSV